MVELVPTYQWPRFDLRFVATGFVVPSLIFDSFTSEEQQSTNQNKKSKKKFGEKNKESSENDDPNRKNSEANIRITCRKGHEKLPYIIIDIQKIMKEKKNREQRDSVRKTTPQEKKLENV